MFIERKLVMKYLRRIIEHNMSMKLKYSGGVLIVGPKWCGKTETCTHFAKSILKLDSPVDNFSAKKKAMYDPERALDGEKPMLVDE
ncbi:hypothetical protein FACS1894166_09200 [Bacilli bacterium]|nr:hypothetical protein FACS1894166_09200 [Bacilli bacterium]